MCVCVCVYVCVCACLRVEMERNEEPVGDVTQTTDGSAPAQETTVLVAPQSPALGVSGAQPSHDGESGNGVTGSGESDKVGDVCGAINWAVCVAYSRSFRIGKFLFFFSLS